MNERIGRVLMYILLPYLVLTTVPVGSREQLMSAAEWKISSHQYHHIPIPAIHNTAFIPRDRTQSYQQS